MNTSGISVNKHKNAKFINISFVILFFIIYNHYIDKEGDIRYRSLNKITLIIFVSLTIICLFNIKLLSL